MDKQFTASEVRAEIDQAFRYHVNDMLRTYADLLEEREKTVPMGCLYSLYTQSQSASSDAKRLAEALRKIVEWQPPAVLSRDGKQSSMLCEFGSIGVRDYFRKIAEVALVAHPTQAQPTAASVTVDAVMRVIDGQQRLPYCSIDEKQAFRNKLEAALAAQENPNG